MVSYLELNYISISIEYSCLVHYWFVYFFYSNNDTSKMNHDALGESIDFKSDSINLCLDATWDDEAGVCVCVFLASGYEWVTVLHEIPISSAQSMTSFFHTLGLSSTTPLVPLAGADSHEKAPTSP